MMGVVVALLMNRHNYLLLFSDEDECAGEHPCHSDGECVDIYGGFFCQCGSGYLGDGVENCTGI